jgi:hypothetical protein
MWNRLKALAKTNPARALARQFLRQSPITLLVVGTALSLLDLAAMYGAATKDGVLHISQGVGLLSHYGFFSTIVGNAIAVYAAKKYYDGVCSLRCSKALTDKRVIQPTLMELENMIKGEGRYQLSIYLLAIFGALCWLLNVGIHLVGDPVSTWGLVLDSTAHRWTFVAMRFHNLYTWLIIMPLVAHVMIFSTIQLRAAITIASASKVLKYDLLNPDHRGGFGFVDNSLIAFNVVAALIYVEVTLHYETFGKLNLQHIVDYVVVTVMLFAINKMFFGDMYALVRRLRLKALNKVKDDVFNDNKLSFEVLKYCYERRIHTSSIGNFVIKAAAIAIPGIVKFWPFIVRTLARV